MKINTKLVAVTPYYMFLRQVSDNMEGMRASRDGVERFFPMQFGGLFGQKTVLDLNEVMEVTEFDGAERAKPGAVTKYVRGI